MLPGRARASLSTICSHGIRMIASSAHPHRGWMTSPREADRARRPRASCRAMLIPSYRRAPSPRRGSTMAHRSCRCASGGPPRAPLPSRALSLHQSLESVPIPQLVPTPLPVCRRYATRGAPSSGAARGLTSPPRCLHAVTRSVGTSRRWKLTAARGRRWPLMRAGASTMGCSGWPLAISSRHSSRWPCVPHSRSNRARRSLSQACSRRTQRQWALYPPISGTCRRVAMPGPGRTARTKGQASPGTVPLRRRSSRKVCLAASPPLLRRSSVRNLPETRTRRDGGSSESNRAWRHARTPTRAPRASACARRISSTSTSPLGPPRPSASSA